MIVGLCHGVFDVLHYGHVRHLAAARAMCDELVVSLTADQFVNKGPNRPVFTLAHRIEVLRSIVHVSRVIESPYPTAVQSLEAVRPNKYFKDVEYRDSSHPGFLSEKGFCQANGIDLVFTEETGYSSTAAIQRLREVANG